jgi:FkbM family methyltransferase
MKNKFFTKNCIKKFISVGCRNKIRALLPEVFHRRVSYSQCGEDIIFSHLINNIFSIKKIRYLDVGANHPFHLSNTALFYKRGNSGIVVEPDPYFANLLRKKRPRDKVLECGVHFSGEKSAVFYIMDSPTLNTFSEQEMLRYVDMGHKLTSKQLVNLIDINSILEDAGELDFLNIDIEGLDYEVLQRIDWVKFRPKCVCVETITYEKNNEPKKLHKIIELMSSSGYVLYADTFINSIFVDSRLWSSHWIITTQV